VNGYLGIVMDAVWFSAKESSPLDVRNAYFVGWQLNIRQA
jgi:hypothetical protein